MSNVIEQLENWVKDVIEKNAVVDAQVIARLMALVKGINAQPVWQHLKLARFQVWI